MSNLFIEQAIYSSEDANGYRFLAKSPGFLDEWLPRAQRLCTAFGEPPAGVAALTCLFVQPFGPKHVAVVQVTDRGLDDEGRPGTLRFRLLIVPRKLYAALEGDPFWLAEAFPPPREVKGELPALAWTAGAPPRRTVAALQKVLNVPHSATLLGATQALIDGSRVVFARSEPDPAILRNLWALLPSHSRCELWPATFAFDNLQAFHAVATPAALTPNEPGWIHEEQAGDYPEGRYELNLQIAVESGNQRDLDQLLARKTRWHMIQLAAVLLIALLGIMLVFPLEEAKTPPRPAAVLELPPENECPPLSEHERKQLEKKLQEIAARLHIDLPTGTSDRQLTEALAALDAKLGIPDAKRNREPLRQYGPIQRQVRALLWTHDVADYKNRELNTVELVEKLEERFVGV
jgi:hypothetical protein